MCQINYDDLIIQASHLVVHYQNSILPEGHQYLATTLPSGSQIVPFGWQRPPLKTETKVLLIPHMLNRFVWHESIFSPFFQFFFS